MSRSRLQRATWGTALFTFGVLSQVWAQEGVARPETRPLVGGVVPAIAVVAQAAALPQLLPLAFGLPNRPPRMSDAAVTATVADGQPHVLAAVPETPAGGEVMSGRPPRSVGRSLLYSAIVPGAGQFYNGSKRGAALFFGLEVVGWGIYLNWNSKGNDIEDEFRARADTAWSPLSYLAWRTSTIARNSSITHALPCSSYVANIAASTVPEALKGCAGSEIQQYYELVGKYNQFVSGWADVTDEDGVRVQPTQVDSAENFLSEIRLTYEDRRNDSNKYLKRASTIGGLILVNHVISAVDAARVAKKRRLGESEARIAGRTRLLFSLREDSVGRTMPMLVAYRPLR